MYVKVDSEKDGLARALKIFNKKVKQSELFQEIKNRRYYLKPSEKRLFKQREAFRKKKREERRNARYLRYNN
jgi:small subunit ribosomal protein S21